ncbi:MAG TPA: ROK family transcriptional regulator [Galbitalea sp.]|jgi:predicted NBD/HSP70 family sugar kinase|nr:ROK family transcriptional regulator [Galbitalea sp.]
MALVPPLRTDINRSAILAHLGAQGPASRADLARMLGVSPAQVTQLSRELIADGLVQELENSPSQGGRPGRLLGVVSTAIRAIGVKVVVDHVAFVEVGVDGAVTRSGAEPFDALSNMAITNLIAILRRFIDGGSDTPLLGIGVGIPGTVNEQDAGVVDSTQLGWNQVPLGAALRQAFALPVVIDNNVNALSMAERLFGLGRNYQNFLVVTVGTGVGGGIVAGGAVLRGSAGGAGDLGHIPVGTDGPVCQCGNRGCLEAFIGEQTLVREAREQNIIGEHAGIQALKKAADSGDEAAQKIFGQAGEYLGRALAGAVNILDPEVVVLLGEGAAAWSHWSYGFEPAFRGSLVPGKRGVSVVVEPWQDDGWAQGAAALVLATSFDTEGIAGEQGRLVRERLIEHIRIGEASR